ncbi:ComF family protein [Sporomusa sp. KB1]|jgi:ComF family protein|uniref:ComF family protein n=1 Tax=Sporomusa sp. KB1 TaxID=943346 RepID=UPI00119FD6E9|nr:ComF family protein [Sporomusa sp. KB1]TWH45249.1 ComF family protein [Sporomusa sp. KB1]
MLKDWWAALLALLFPQRCPACHAWAEGTGWCSTCIAQVSKPRQVALALHNLRWLDECLTVTDYTGPVQRLIRDMKFRRMTRQATKLSQLLDYAIVCGRYADIDVIVAVPLHAERIKERGFNQTALVFKPWAARQKLIWTEALDRTRPTVPQWELTLKERRKNIKGAFAVTRPELITGKHILLVDDIFTSGLTMEECARVLKKAGAVAVKGLALASGAR